MNTIPKEWQFIRTTIPGKDGGFFDPEASKGDSVFHPDKARDAIAFMEEGCTHVKGSLAGKAFILEPWQKAIIACAFGYIRRDGFRRFQEIFLYVARKNGKSTFAAAIILLIMFTDGEIGAELYSAAAERGQACLVYDQAKGMVRNNESFDEATTIYKTGKSIVYHAENSSYKAISAEAGTKHGFNTHAAIIDELHAQPNRELVDVIMTSTGSRDQPLIIHVTTADYARESICNEKYEYAKRVRDGLSDDNSFLPVIYEATTDDDWTDPKVWAKANPNLGVSVKVAYLQRECKRAQEEPSFENTFKRLHLNIQTEQADRWLPMDAWDNCAGEMDYLELCNALEGEECWAGLDLSSTQDITALVLYFPEQHALLPFFWLPRATMHKREKKSGRPWGKWEKQGYAYATPGNVVDYGFVIKTIVEMSKRYSLQGIGYDPWNATKSALTLQDDYGINIIEFRQGFKSMNEPSKEFEKLLVEGKLRHGGHPVLREMAAYVSVKRDESDNIKPDKKSSTDRIDGIVSSIMAIGMSMTQINEGSVYNERGLLSV